MATLVALLQLFALPWGGESSAARSETPSTKIPVRGDAFVRAREPDTNFGTRVGLRARGAPRVITYAKVEVPADAGPIAAAHLKIRARAVAPTRVVVRSAGNGWKERTVTFATRPRLGERLAVVDVAQGAGWLEIDVSAAIDGPGIYSFALIGKADEPVVFYSTESRRRPRLLISGPHPPSATTTTTTTTTRPPPTTTQPPRAGFTFAAGGDFGARPATGAVLDAIAASDAEMLLALGDLSYGDLTESAWCNYFKNRLGDRFPVELIVGNHEDDARVDGYIGNFTGCLPDRMGAVGRYGAEYYFDVPELARFIMIGADTRVGGVTYDYAAGSARYNWLRDRIAAARSAGLPWVIVGFHKNCLTVGKKSCEVGQDLLDLLIASRVDLVLQGHEHTYQRSKQLTCATRNLYRPGCVSDAGGDGRVPKGGGTVIVVSGASGGGNLYDANSGDLEAGYFAAWMGANSPQPGRGYTQVRLTPDRLSLEFVGVTTGYGDSLIID